MRARTGSRFCRNRTLTATPLPIGEELKMSQGDLDMSNIKTFHLPDLGEGLPDATVVEWFVSEGDVVTLDAPLVSMETAKAVVEVPSPYSGKVARLHGKAGDVIDTGAAL